MYGCQYVGIDDPARRRTLPIDQVIRAKAAEEIQTVANEYIAFLAGDGNPKYIVPPKKIQDRLDVKSCLMKTGRKVDDWHSRGFEVKKLGDFVTLKEFSDDDIIETEDSDEFVTYLRVRYDSFAEAGDEKFASDTQYSHLYRVHEGDIVISNIAALYGSVAVVPKELDGCVVSTEYTVLQPKPGEDARIVWMLLRSPEAKAEMLLLATGANRTRVRWEKIENLRLPCPATDEAKDVSTLLQQAEEAERQAAEYRRKATRLLESPLELDDEEAQAILRAFKPPR